MIFWALSSFSHHLWEPYIVFISTHFLLPLRTHLHPWQHLRKQKSANRKKRQGSEWMGTQPTLFSVCFPTPSFPSEFVCCWERRFFKMGIISKEHLNHSEEPLMELELNCIFTGSFVRNLPGRLAQKKNENSYSDRRFSPLIAICLKQNVVLNLG